MKIASDLTVSFSPAEIETILEALHYAAVDSDRLADRVKCQALASHAREQAQTFRQMIETIARRRVRAA